MAGNMYTVLPSLVLALGLTMVTIGLHILVRGLHRQLDLTERRFAALDAKIDRLADLLHTEEKP